MMLPQLVVSTDPKLLDPSPKTSTATLIEPEDGLRVPPGAENDFTVENNPFAYTPGQLSKLLNPKSLSAYKALGGLRGIEKGLLTDLRSGLSVDESPNEAGIGGGSSTDSTNIQTRAMSDGLLLDRRRVFGVNKLPERRGKSISQLFWENYLSDKTLALLTASAVVSLTLGLHQSFRYPTSGPEVIEGVAIIATILLVVAVGSLNDYYKERQFARLNRKKENRTVKAVRSGRTIELSVHDILVGDVVCLEPGDVISADGIFIDGYSVKCDESSSTGESDLAKKLPGHHALEGKRNGDPFIISGTRVMEGMGTYVVTSTGVNSTHGMLLSSFDNKSRAMEQQTSFARNILAIIIKLMSPVHFLTVLSSMAAYLSLGIFKWLWPYALITMGPTKVTQASAKLVSQAATETHVAAATWLQDASRGYDKLPDFSSVGSSGRVSLLRDLIALCSTAFEATEHVHRFIGLKTEVALLNFARDHLDLGDLAERRSEANILQVIPFDSRVKFMAAVVELDNGKARLYVKGFPEVLVANCSEFMVDPMKSETAVELDDLTRESISAKVDKYLANNLRAVGMAYRDLENWSPSEMSEDNDREAIMKDMMKDMTLVGVVGIRDPTARKFPEAARGSQASGVKIRMVTGDNMITATAIARECGILDALTPEDGLRIEEPQFRKLSSNELETMVPRLRMLARSSPEDKRILVKRLKAMGETMSTTGDGSKQVNAELSPLRAGNVGPSMGIAGTEVATETPDIILMDDNFTSIVKALMWGRAVNDGVKRYLESHLLANASLALPHILNMTLGDSHLAPIPVMLSISQILWVNLMLAILVLLNVATDARHTYTPKRNHERGRSTRSWSSTLRRCSISKLIIAGTVFSHCATPIIATGLLGRFSSAIRIGSGVTSAGSAVAIIPLRTVEGVPSVGYIMSVPAGLVCCVGRIRLTLHHEQILCDMGGVFCPVFRDAAHAHPRCKEIQAKDVRSPSRP